MADMHLPHTPDYEALFRVTFEQAAIGIAHVAPDGRWIRVNHKLSDMLGYGHGELLDLTFHDVTYPGDLDADLDQLNALLAGHVSSYQMEKRYIRKNGKTVWAHLTVSLVRKADGTPDYFISVVEDIQARKDDEATIRLQKAQLQVVFENLDAGIVMADLNGDIVYWNRRAREMHGYDDDQNLNRNVAEFMSVFEFNNAHGHVLPLSDWPLMRILCGETLRGLDLIVRRKDMDWQRLYRYRGSLALDNTGKAVMAMIIISSTGSEDT
ncbi:MAG: PAS domain S-box protein [Pedobacter sp.]|nr:PAS domain S-box protein [Pedobacter sp.]